MTFKGLFKSLATVLLFTFFFSCADGPAARNTDGVSRQLTVVMDIDMPGYFSLEGEDFGYQYDLLKAYADMLGMELNVITGYTPSDCENLLRAGEADIVTALSHHLGPETGAIPLYNTTYVLLASRAQSAYLKGKPVMEVHEMLEGNRVLISGGFRSSASYDMLLDSLRTADTFLSSRPCIELMEGLRDGTYDFLICEKSEAQMGMALVHGLGQLYEFPDEMTVSVAVSDARRWLPENFGKWLSVYKQGTEYEMLNALYFERGIVGKLVEKGHARKPSKVISEYDRLMREICEKEGYDWRLISAIAYNESRFDPHVVSRRGAAGLMQIMPSTARQFDVSVDEVTRPEINILLATKLLGRIESMLRFGNNTSYNDRMSIILACYNCGIGHVLDARRLAAKYGANPDSWKDVSSYLALKADPAYSGDEAVRCGSFRGSGETLAFVSNVMGRYDTYCSMVRR